MPLRVLQSIFEFLIRSLEGMRNFLQEFIPLVCKVLFLLSPMLLLIVASYFIGGFKWAIPALMVCGVILLSGVIWLEKRNIEVTTSELSDKIVFFTAVLDITILIIFIVIVLSSQHLQHKIERKFSKSTPDREGQVIEKRQKTQKEKKEEIFLTSLKQAIPKVLVDGSKIYDINSEKFVIAMNTLEEMQSLNKIPISFILETLNKCRYHVDIDISGPSCAVKKERELRSDCLKVSAVCIDFLIKMNAKDSCELLYVIQTKRGSLYEKAKEASLKICEQNSSYSIDQQAKQDMLKRPRQDPRRVKKAYGSIPRTGKGIEKGDENDIRHMDFRKFTYHLGKTTCAEMLDSSIVQVRNGEFGNPADVYFEVDTNRIIYGDLTGDGHDEAIVITYCGGMHPIEQAFVYTMTNGRALLLTKLEEGDRAFGGIVDNGINIKNGLLTVERTWGDAACCPKYIEKKMYRWNSRRLVQVGKSQRKKFILNRRK